MCSEKKRASNRSNAAKSTGPRTPDGKARSSQNGVTHGMFCRRAVLVGESQEEFNDLRRGVHQRFAPRDVFEVMLVDRVVLAMWKLKRLHEAEACVHAARGCRMDQARREANMRRRVESTANPLDIEDLDKCFEVAEQTLEQAVAEPVLATPACMSQVMQLHDPGVLESPVRRDELDRLSQLEARLERTIHRSLTELRKLRADDPGKNLRTADENVQSEPKSGAAERAPESMQVIEDEKVMPDQGAETAPDTFTRFHPGVSAHEPASPPGTEQTAPARPPDLSG
jgi:hypothetical protein